VLKKIAVNQLTVGMFVHGFDESWLKHPFWRNRFLIKDPATMREIQLSGVKHCWIDISQGQDVPAPQPVVAAPEPQASPEPTRARATLSD